MSTRRSMDIWGAALVVALTLSWSDVALGQEITIDIPKSRTLPAGTFDVDLDALGMLHFEQSSVPDMPDRLVSVWDVLMMAGVTPRYFIFDNISVGLKASLLYQKASEVVDLPGEVDKTERNDLGVVGTVRVGYSIPLVYDFYLYSGLGGGAFYGKRAVPHKLPDGGTAQTTITGGVWAIDLMAHYYLTTHVHVHAGVELLMRIGTEELPSNQTKDFLATDAGVTAGMGFTF